MIDIVSVDVENDPARRRIFSDPDLTATMRDYNTDNRPNTFSA